MRSLLLASLLALLAGCAHSKAPAKSTGVGAGKETTGTTTKDPEDAVETDTDGDTDSGAMPKGGKDDQSDDITGDFSSGQK